MNQVRKQENTESKELAAGIAVLLSAMVGGGIMGFMAGILATIYQAWIVTVMWSWFIVSQFHVDPISLPWAIGVMSLIDLVIAKLDLKKHEALEGWVMFGTLSWALFGAPTIVLLTGFIMKLFL